MNVQATLNYRADENQAAEAEVRWLVQIHPLDLDCGPIELRNEVTSLGRSVDCTIHVNDESVSRRHAEIHRLDSGYQVVDLQSTNGVLVNELPVERALLRSGDRIQLGARVYRFLADNDFEAQYHETVYSMMTRDGLTGAYNKRYLLESLSREIHRCIRHQRPIAVALMDIDYFKSINDTYGHLVGDEVLKELTRRLQSVLRADEILSRFGGEEFAVVMVEAGREAAVEVAERCREAIASQPFETSAGPLNVTASFGVSAPPCECLNDCDSILVEADARLYQAKRDGRNCVKS